MSLRYPLEAGANGADTVVFSHEEYRNNRPKTAGNAQGGGGGAANIGPPPAGGGAITLYMPNSTPNPNNGQNWGSKGFAGPLNEFRSNAAIAAEAVISETDSKNFQSSAGMQSLGNSVGAATGSILSDGIDKAGSIGKQFLTDFAAKAGTFDSASQLLSMSRGEIYNPNVELLYSGTRLRTFSFTYTFVPKSQQEAEGVNRIIMEFKKFSAPEEVNGMFKVPHVWNVIYMTGGKKNPNMNAFKKAALQSVSVAHNPGMDMHMTFPNGMPIVTSLQLAFQEVDIITRGDHETSGSNVGY